MWSQSDVSTFKKSLKTEFCIKIAYKKVICKMCLLLQAYCSDHFELLYLCRIFINFAHIPLHEPFTMNHFLVEEVDKFLWCVIRFLWYPTEPRTGWHLALVSQLCFCLRLGFVSLKVNSNKEPVKIYRVPRPGFWKKLVYENLALWKSRLMKISPYENLALASSPCR